MTELRERVARAICESTEADVFDELPERSIYRAVYFQQADAAISAVMQDLEAPTPALINAVANAMPEPYPTFYAEKALKTIASQYRKEQA